MRNRLLLRFFLCCCIVATIIPLSYARRCRDLEKWCCALNALKCTGVRVNCLYPHITSEHEVTRETIIERISELHVTMESKLDLLDSKVDELFPFITSEHDLTRETIIDRISELHVTMESKLDLIDAKIDELSKQIGGISCGATLIDGGTIYIPGLYKVTASENVSIEVDSNNVTIDLCEKTLSGVPTSALPIIKILGGHENITIKNGALNGNDKNNDGILLGSNTRDVFVEDIRFINCDNGITFNEAKNGKATNCYFDNCNKAVVLNDTECCIFKCCDTSSCKEAGFALTNSSFNKFKMCEAISTGDDNSEKGATAFSSSDGAGNLFLQCVAEGTFKEDSNFCKNATGFLLKSQEKETKIIDCIVNSTKCVVSDDEDGLANARGIHLDMLLKDQGEESKICEKAYGSDLYSASWSPNSEYIAIGGESGFGSANALYVLNAKDADFGIVAFNTEVSITETTEVKWSPNGQFLAAGTKGEGANGVFIYEFNSKAGDINDRLERKVFFFADMEIVLGIDWSPDGQYLAILYLEDDKRSVKVAVLSFDGEDVQLLDTSFPAKYEAELPPSEIDPFIGDLSFSPDGKKIAVVLNAKGEDDKPALILYDFNPLAEYILDLTRNETLDDFDKVHTVDFSPIGCLDYFIAVGGKNFIKVMHLRGSVGSFVTERDLTDVTALRWSTNGKYLLVTRIGSNVRIYEFNFSNTTNMLDKKIELNNGGGISPISCDWSPSGRDFVTVSSVSTATADEKNIFVYEVGNVPQRCVVERNKVCNTTGGLCGIGIEGAGGENCIVKNEGYENNINFSWGIFNHFVDGLNKNPKMLDNISVPPYFSSLIVNS